MGKKPATVVPLGALARASEETFAFESIESKGSYARFASYGHVDFVRNPLQASLYSSESVASRRKNAWNFPGGLRLVKLRFRLVSKDAC